MALKNTHRLKATASMSFEVGTMIFDNRLTIIFLLETDFSASWGWGRGRSCLFPTVPISYEKALP